MDPIEYLKPLVQSHGVQLLKVFYKTFNVCRSHVYLGNNLTEYEVQGRPTIFYPNFEETELYTVILIDYDSPETLSCKHKVYPLLWLCINIQNNFKTEDDQMVNYTPPLAVDSYFKRNVFLLYAQSGFNDIKEIITTYLVKINGRIYLNLDNFVRDKVLLMKAVNFFYCRKTDYKLKNEFSASEMANQSILNRKITHIDEGSKTSVTNRRLLNSPKCAIKRNQTIHDNIFERFVKPEPQQIPISSEKIVNSKKSQNNFYNSDYSEIADSSESITRPNDLISLETNITSTKKTAFTANFAEKHKSNSLIDLNKEVTKVDNSGTNKKWSSTKSFLIKNKNEDNNHFLSNCFEKDLCPLLSTIGSENSMTTSYESVSSNYNLGKQKPNFEITTNKQTIIHDESPFACSGVERRWSSTKSFFNKMYNPGNEDFLTNYSNTSGHKLESKINCDDSMTTNELFLEKYEKQKSNTISNNVNKENSLKAKKHDDHIVSASDRPSGAEERIKYELNKGKESLLNEKSSIIETSVVYPDQFVRKKLDTNKSSSISNENNLYRPYFERSMLKESSINSADSIKEYVENTNEQKNNPNE